MLPLLIINFYVNCKLALVGARRLGATHWGWGRRGRFGAIVAAFWVYIISLVA